MGFLVSRIGIPSAMHARIVPCERIHTRICDLELDVKMEVLDDSVAAITGSAISNTITCPPVTAKKSEVFPSSVM